MGIQIAGPATVTVAGPEVVFVLEDTGGALVSILVLIKGQPSIRHEEPDEDAGGDTRSLQPGTYECGIQISAFREGALGITYRTVASADGEVFASAEGVVPKDPGAAFGFRKFTLVVT